MGLSELFLELNNEGYAKVWLLRTYGEKDDDGNPLLLDLLLCHTGEEIARCGYWPEQTERDWKMTVWGMKNFGALPADAVELDVARVLTRLSIGIKPDAVLGAAPRQTGKQTGTLE